MNGVAAIRQLLVARAQLIALAPAARIQAGVLPLGIELSALGIMSVSKVSRNIPNPGNTRHVTERVQVTGAAATYPALKALMPEIEKACADQMPTVAGISNVVVLLAGTGPEMMDEGAAFYMQSQDFSVSYTEAR